MPCFGHIWFANWKCVSGNALHNFMHIVANWRDLKKVIKRSNTVAAVVFYRSSRLRKISQERQMYRTWKIPLKYTTLFQFAPWDKQIVQPKVRVYWKRVFVSLVNFLPSLLCWIQFYLGGLLTRVTDALILPIISQAEGLKKPSKRNDIGEWQSTFLRLSK